MFQRFNNHFTIPLMMMKLSWRFRFILVAFFASPFLALAQQVGVRVVVENKYPDCIELSNRTTRVVLEPNLGGRVLKYELNGKNVLFVDPKDDGRIWEKGVSIHPCGGRSDFGPEKTVPSHPLLFMGKWTGKITGTRQAELISQKDSITGVQLVRRFKLAENGSLLEFTQIIRNVSKETKRYCHWSRTFMKGGGISLIPLRADSRYPKGYLTYGPGPIINFMPEKEENIGVRDGILEITGLVKLPKFMTDGTAGWLAYINKDDQLFIKRYPVYPDRIYGEMAAGTASVYYFKEDYCEIEPIGPMELIAPGKEVSFTEQWLLSDYPYPRDKKADLQNILARVREIKKEK
ncbi:MAG: hypothetical protein WCK18_17200 [Prolixibacteraceae bacterium]